MKHDELMPPRPGRRSWTRAEDYLPSRRRRPPGGQPLAASSARLGDGDRVPDRPSLGVIPFVMLMIGLGIMAMLVAIVAWPARQPAQAPVKTAAATEKMVTLTPPERR